MKNIMVLALNFRQDNYDVRDEKGEYSGNFNTLSEGILKYLIYLLERENQTLDYILVISDKENEWNHNGFRGFFPEIPMDFFVLENGLIKENLSLAADVFNKIIEYKNSEEVEINFEIPGDFRYNSVMMPLIELVKYNNLNVGRIFYVNSALTPKVIEEVSPYLNISALASGADEFVYNGNTRKLQDFFCANEARDHVKNLLEKMTAFSETLRICGSYEVTENALTELGDAVKNYELYLDIRLKRLLDKTSELSESLKKCKDSETAEAILSELTAAITEYKASVNKKENIDLNEFYFNKLLPKIKSEYQDVLTESSPIGIIRWCLKRGFLQQAVTFYADWLPKFLTEEGYINILDKSVMEDCKEYTSAWSHWSNFLFRNYQVRAPFRLNITHDNGNLHKELMPVFRSGEVDKVLQALNSRNPQLENFLLYVRDFCREYTVETAQERIVNLSQDDMIRKLLQAVIPGNIKFSKFVASRIKNEKNIEHVLVRALAALPKNQIKNFYGYGSRPAPVEGFNKKLRSRREVFEVMLKNNIIATTLDEDKLLGFVESYDLIVRGLRNKVAHAVADSGTMENQDDIVNIIAESLDFIDG